MFNELVAKLKKRGVNVTVTGNYSVLHEHMKYSADVTIDRYGTDETWPVFNFKVFGRELDELAHGINRRLPLVEPIIAARETHRAHREAVKSADRIGEALMAIVKGERCDEQKTAS